MTNTLIGKKSKRLAGGLALTFAMSAVLSACSGSNGNSGAKEPEARLRKGTAAKDPSRSP